MAAEAGWSLTMRANHLTALVLQEGTPSDAALQLLYCY
jgi:hypothetical protein